MKPFASMILTTLTIGQLAACNKATTQSTARIQMSSQRVYKSNHANAIVDQLRWQLDKVRTACESYRRQNGNEHPDFGTAGWAPLLNQQYLRGTPKNPLSPREVATTIIVVKDPSMTGKDVDPGEAGWVWNPLRMHGGMMYAAGLN